MCWAKGNTIFLRQEKKRGYPRILAAGEQEIGGAEKIVKIHTGNKKKPFTKFKTSYKDIIIAFYHKKITKNKQAILKFKTEKTEF